MVVYTKVAVERAMQVQEVILRAIGKRIRWWEAAEHGYDGLKRIADVARRAAGGTSC